MTAKAQLDTKGKSKAALAIAAREVAEAKIAVANAEAAALEILPLQIPGVVASLASDGGALIETLKEDQTTRSMVSLSAQQMLAVAQWGIENYQEGS